MRLAKPICLILAAGLLAVPSITIPLRPQSGGQSVGPEQTVFRIEGREEKKKHGQYVELPPVEHPVPLPEDALNTLRKDSRVAGCVQPGMTEAPATWFQASAIHLHNNDQNDYIVLPIDGCLFGAGVAPMWVFVKSAKGYELAMTTDTLQLEVLNSRTNEYRDINASSLTATMIMVIRFNFDGQKYQLGKVVGTYRLK